MPDFTSPTDPDRLTVVAWSGPIPDAVETELGELVDVLGGALFVALYRLTGARGGMVSTAANRASGAQRKDHQANIDGPLDDQIDRLVARIEAAGLTPTTVGAELLASAKAESAGDAENTIVVDTIAPHPRRG